MPTIEELEEDIYRISVCDKEYISDSNISKIIFGEHLPLKPEEIIYLWAKYFSYDFIKQRLEEYGIYNYKERRKMRGIGCIGEYGDLLGNNPELYEDDYSEYYDEEYRDEPSISLEE